MSVVPQRTDLFKALKGKILDDLKHYNDPENCKTFSQPARVCGRKEGYEQVLVWIDELMNTDVLG